jgi:cytochrome c
LKNALTFIAAACFTAGVASSATAAEADGAALSDKYKCKACHAVDLKIVGPRFRDVAKKYAGDASAPEKLATKIRSGGSGAWGAIPMPPRYVPDADLKPLVAWILSQG